jgi:hypothetical protein
LTKTSGTDDDDDDDNNNNNVGATFDSLFIHVTTFAQWCNETQATVYKS